MRDFLAIAQATVSLFTNYAIYAQESKDQESKGLSSGSMQARQPTFVEMLFLVVCGGLLQEPAAAVTDKKSTSSAVMLRGERHLATPEQIHDEEVIKVFMAFAKIAAGIIKEFSNPISPVLFDNLQGKLDFINFVINTLYPQALHSINDESSMMALNILIVVAFPEIERYLLMREAMLTPSRPFYAFTPYAAHDTGGMPQWTLPSSPEYKWEPRHFDIGSGFAAGMIEGMDAQQQQSRFTVLRSDVEEVLTGGDLPDLIVDEGEAAASSSSSSSPSPSTPRRRMADMIAPLPPPSLSTNGDAASEGEFVIVNVSDAPPQAGQGQHSSPADSTGESSSAWRIPGCLTS